MMLNKTPLSKSIMVLQGLIKGTFSVNLFKGDILLHNFLDVWFRHFKLSLHCLLPVKWSKEGVFFNFICISFS